MSYAEFYGSKKTADSASVLSAPFTAVAPGVSLREYYAPARAGPGIATGFQGSEFETRISPDNFDNLHGLIGPVVAVAFSPDGTRVAAGSKAGKIRVWSMNRTQPARDLIGHDGMVASIAFSPKGLMLASGSEDGSIRVWEMSSGRTQLELTGHTATVASLTFSKNGLQILSASEDKTVRVWDITDGSGRIISGQKPDLVATAFSPDRRTAALSSQGKMPTLKLLNLDEPNYRFLCDINAVAHALVFSPDGKTLAAGLANNTVQYWNLATDESHILVGHQQPVFAIAHPPDRDVIVSGSADGSIRIWSKTGDNTHLVIATEAKVWSIAFSQDGNLMAVGLGNGHVRVFGYVEPKSKSTAKTAKRSIKSFFTKS